MNRQSYLDGITLLSVAYTDEAPMKPADADFGVTIDFEKGVSDPVKVFESMAMMLGGLRKIDEVVIGAIDNDLSPVMVLEDVEAASITSWVKTKIKKIDDQALKEFDIKQQIGAYAVKAKYKILEYLDKAEEREGRERLETLADDLSKLGMELPANRRLLPPTIEAKALVTPMNQIQQAKSLLGPNDTMTVRSNGVAHTINTRATGSVAVSETVSTIRRVEGDRQMILLVKKPDYLGKSKWEFRCDKTPIQAHITDEDWLHSFRTGEIVLQPGSSLTCSVHYRVEYDEAGKVTDSDYEIKRVVDTTAPTNDAIFDLFKEEA